MRMGDATAWAKARALARGPAAARAAVAAEYLSNERRVVLDITTPGIAARDRVCKQSRSLSRPFCARVLGKNAPLSTRPRPGKRAFSAAATAPRFRFSLGFQSVGGQAADLE